MEINLEFRKKKTREKVAISKKKKKMYHLIKRENIGKIWKDREEKIKRILVK